MAKKESSEKLSSLAGRVLRGYQPTREEIIMLCASVLTQDEKRSTKPRKASKRAKAR